MTQSIQLLATWRWAGRHARPARRLSGLRTDGAAHDGSGGAGVWRRPMTGPLRGPRRSAHGRLLSTRPPFPTM